VLVGFSRIFLLGILIFKHLTARRHYKSFGVKGLMKLSLLYKFYKDTQHISHENPSSGSRLFHADNWTDMTKLMAAFRHFTNASKTRHNGLSHDVKYQDMRDDIDHPIQPRKTYKQRKYPRYFR
jgi:hypothetical protein